MGTVPEKNIQPGRLAYLRDWEKILTDAELTFVIGRRIKKNHDFLLVIGALLSIADAAHDDGHYQGQAVIMDRQEAAADAERELNRQHEVELAERAAA